MADTSPRITRSVLKRQLGDYSGIRGIVKGLNETIVGTIGGDRVIFEEHDAIADVIICSADIIVKILLVSLLMHLVNFTGENNLPSSSLTNWKESMANASPHTTAGVTKRPLEDDDIIHRLNQQRLDCKAIVGSFTFSFLCRTEYQWGWWYICGRLAVADKASMKLLSIEEQKVFSLDRWFRPKSMRHRYTRKNIALGKKFYYHGLYFIREAYLSISGTGSEDMMELLKDESGLTCRGSSKSMELLLKKLGLLQSEVEKEVSLLPSTKTRELERIGNGKPISCSAVHFEGDDQFSIKVYNMLLILNKLLTQLGFKSKDFEGYGHAELTEIVQDRMSLLRIEMEQAETLLIEQINSVYMSECVSASDELRYKLNLGIRSNIQGFALFLSSNKEIYPAFKKLIDLMDDICLRWYREEKGQKFLSREAVMEWRKHIAGTPWTAEKFLNFNWNI
ncbi:hypothetical protein FRX31_020393 [Thalictrum thalictroides]|uniref:Uncharacterized protein n=1 Tax=Thalictrum thalictroides TaxID=46969 RepID=A0A7J6VY17_THATH|nr:hypothetical protein FRX31_020393 [Thalictrum thalictroides]